LLVDALQDNLNTVLLSPPKVTFPTQQFASHVVLNFSFKKKLEKELFLPSSTTTTTTTTPNGNSAKRKAVGGKSCKRKIFLLVMCGNFLICHVSHVHENADNFPFFPSKFNFRKQSKVSKNVLLPPTTTTTTTTSTTSVDVFKQLNFLKTSNLVLSIHPSCESRE